MTGACKRTTNDVFVKRKPAVETAGANDCLPYERRHGWIRTTVKGFTDLRLAARPRDYNHLELDGQLMDWVSNYQSQVLAFVMLYV